MKSSSALILKFPCGGKRGAGAAAPDGARGVLATILFPQSPQGWRPNFGSFSRLPARLPLLYGRIEKFRDDREEQFGASHDPMIRGGPANMRGGRKHGELGRRETDQVAVRLTTAEQTKELHRVRDAQAYCVPDQDQGGCFERRNALGPIVVLAQKLPHF